MVQGKAEFELSNYFLYVNKDNRMPNRQQLTGQVSQVAVLRGCQ
jgi:hypothetical protein